MLQQNFDATIDAWIQSISNYEFELLCIQPSPDAWSLGQVSMHLLNETAWYLEQVVLAATADDHGDREMTEEGKKMFLNNCFPDERLTRPGDSTTMPFPESKEKLFAGLSELKDRIRITEKLVMQSTGKGKTKHPGLGYFSATEWLQFAEMHFRHHFKQKKRIEDFLNSINTNG